MKLMRNTTAVIEMMNKVPIQSGDSTHHHDHAITLVSLSVMNTMVSRPAKPIPPLEFDDDAMQEDYLRWRRESNLIVN